MQQMVLDMGLGCEPTLDNFLPDGNADVLAHLRLWVSMAQRSPVPTYLWGPSGSGKSHLLRAVAGVLRAQGESVGWLDARVVAPLMFDERWSVVVMDDCHLYTADQQAAAFNWFVHAQTPASGAARWVLASGDRPPADLVLRDDLRSRLGWGHVFQLAVLGESDRRAVLRREADSRGILLGDEVMDYMLHRFSRDLSSLMLLLDRLDGYALRTQRPITIPLLKAMLHSE